MIGCLYHSIVDLGRVHRSSATNTDVLREVCALLRGKALSYGMVARSTTNDLAHWFTADYNLSSFLQLATHTSMISALLHT
jgi:hypothetical protein